MKFIVAIIQPYRLDAVREALNGVGVNGLTVTEVRGYGRQRGHTEVYRGAEYTINYVPKLKLEVAVEDHAADELDVEMALAERAFGRLAHGGEGVHQDIVEGLARRHPAAQPVGARLERVVAERGDFGFGGVDGRDIGFEALEHALVMGIEQATGEGGKHGFPGWGRTDAAAGP